MIPWTWFDPYKPWGWKPSNALAALAYFNPY